MAATPVLRGRLSHTDRLVLTTILVLSKSLGYAPSVREIQAELGYASPSSIHGHLHTLRRCGAVEWQPGRARTLHITAVGMTVINHPTLL